MSNSVFIKAHVTNKKRIPDHLHARGGDSVMLMPRSSNYVHVKFIESELPAHFTINHIKHPNGEKQSHADYMANSGQLKPKNKLVDVSKIVITPPNSPMVAKQSGT